MRRHQFRADALLEVLHAAQELFGFLPDPVLAHVARGLGLPLSRVYGVASFYNLFRLEPKGEHDCTVCLGTACYVAGGGDLLAGLEEAHGVRPHQRTSDGRLSVGVVRCIGTCGLAPVAVLDGEILGGQTRAGLLQRVKGCLER
jgi:bidirectional [NiFe] hydrogenase diaphorase subunit